MTAPNVSGSLAPTLVNGIRTFWADGPGPMHAVLMFRVGTADEAFHRRGITHAVEHLALHGEVFSGDVVNGWVSQTTMCFRAQGEPAEVAEFLNRVIGRLGDLPMERLEDECRILKAESGRSQRSIHDAPLVYRYGAQGYGGIAFRELGLQEPDPTEVQSWADKYAVADNAVLFLTGEPPAEFTATLPRGQAHPAPDAARNMVPDTPAWIVGATDAVVLHAVVPRSTAGRVTADILQQRLFEVLRRDNPLAYAPSATYDPMDGKHALVAAATDAAERQCEIAGLFVGVFDELATGSKPATADEMSRHANQFRRMLGTDAARASITFAAALSALEGSEVRSEEQLLSELAAVDAAAIQNVAAEILADAILALPPDVEPPPPWTKAPMSVDEPILLGERFRQRQDGSNDPGPAVAMVDGSGVTLSWAKTPPITVRADRAAGVITWGDGRRTLVAGDGCAVSIDPATWRGGDALVQRIDAVFAEVPQVAMTSAPARLTPEAAAERVSKARKQLILQMLLAPVLVPAILLSSAFYGHLVVYILIGYGFWIGHVVGNLRRAKREQRAAQAAQPGDEAETAVEAASNVDPAGIA